MKPLVFTLHAATKMRERGIEPAWVEETARRPLWTEPEPRDAALERRFRPVPEFGGRFLRGVCSETETAIRVVTATFDMTYDPEADAVYVYLGSGQIDHAEETGPFIYDVDSEGRILGIETLSASKVLAPGDWRHARLPGSPRADAAE